MQFENRLYYWQQHTGLPKLSCLLADLLPVCSLKEGFIVGGILLGYLASALWVGETGGWRNMYGAAFIPALILAAGMVISRDALPCYAVPYSAFPDSQHHATS